MPQEYLAIIIPLGGLFIALFPLRLSYIEKQYEHILIKIIGKKDISDSELQKEIKKTKPDKETVLTFANEIATFKHMENDIGSSTRNNRIQVLLDLIALVSIVLLGISLIDNSALSGYWPLLSLVALMAGFFSVFSFMDKFLEVHKLKNKKF